MASDLSSGCTEAIGVLDEKEEGEISLEDVSSSEEGHLNYGYGSRASQCSNCLSTQHNAAWCTAAKFYQSKSSNRREVDLILQDAVQGKENRHQIKESGCVGAKHTVSTLQEKNDDLVPISSDSDMEIVGLADNSKQLVIYNTSKSRVKKKKKKKRAHAPVMSVGDIVSSSTVDISTSECVSTLKHDTAKNNSSRPHHREISPTHRSSRSRAVPRTPPRRHRSLLGTRSPFRRSKSPVVRARSPTVRRSPRKLKSPRKSPYRSPTKTMPRKTSHFDLTTSHNYVETHKLLKKVRQLDSMGTHSLEQSLSKNKEHASSLKEKLSNMMKGVADNNNDTTNSTKENFSAHVTKKESDDIDDEDDLALLRQKALETKQKKSNKQNDQPKIEPATKVSSNIDDDQDEEDLELRMIALRSAVLKKHQNRVQRGIKSGKYKRCNASRSQSPFTQSFLDSIPIPGEKLLNFASPPHTPPLTSENNHTEDMDLDTDVEREKEKLPYSPTDKITASISMDTELLGIQPSDVSFINLNDANNSPNFVASLVSSQNDQKSYPGSIIENRSYLPNLYYQQHQNTMYIPPNTTVQYSATNPVEMPRSDFMKVHSSHVNMHQYESTCNVQKSNKTSDFVGMSSSQESPYSPTDTPVYDPDLSQALPQNLGPIPTSSFSLASLESSYSSSTPGSIQQLQPLSQINRSNKDECLDKADTFSLEPVVGSAATSVTESVSPSSTTVMVDDLPLASSSPSIASLKNLKCLENIPNDVAKGVKETVPEPLYMKGVPDITKDVNKIPTLINRTLVPASILKTNKQLQQPLPVRKCDVQPEPAFKSAEMQPVVISDENNSKTNTSFKPMKLMNVTQKSHSVLTVPVAFHDSLHEDSTNETATNKDTSLGTNKDTTLVQNDVTMNTESSEKISDNIGPIQKKKKVGKKGQKRKGSSSAQLASKRHNAQCTNDDNINIVDKSINETDSKRDEEKLEICTNDKEEAGMNVPNQESKVLNEEIKKEEAKIQSASSSDKMEELKNTESRRQSLDEDEEALRAILLASLTKRVKSTNSISSSASNATVLNIPNNQLSANQTASKNILSTVTITNNSSTILPSNQQGNLYGSENDKNQSNSGDKANTTTVQKSLTVGTSKALSSITSGRKRSVPMTKGPQKKLLKKVAIPASTKVVNNAKKYQNAMLQKKLNLQKAIYSNHKIMENKIVSKVQSNEKWSTTRTSLIPDTQRIVINLQSDTESDSESERQKNKIAITNSITTEKHQTTANNTAEFEKNLDQFLRAVRKKQESMAAARPTLLSQTLKKDTAQAEKPNSSNLHTPLAVRHLPASQQEEYRRLKQQILEREKLKLHRTIESNNSQKNKNVEAAAKLVSSNSPVRELHSKVNQAASPKSQTVNAQQQLNKENCSVKNTSTMSTNVQLSGNRVISAKTLPRTMTNLNVQVSNGNGPNCAGNILQSTNTTRKVFETAAREVSPKAKLAQGLKILSTDEVNRKFVQIQVKNDTNERVVTINDKVTLNSKAIINRGENSSGITNDSTNAGTPHRDTNQFIKSIQKEISNNTGSDNNSDIADSDASTIILSGENRITERKESLDASESTIRLSQLHEDSRATITSVESKDDSVFLLMKCNGSPSDKRSIEEDWEVIRRDVKTELTTLISLPRAELEQRLTDTEQKLVMQRYNILDELAEMSGNLRQWHMERDLQTNLVAEVRKLREQLKVAEERLQLQRNRINSIGPKVVAAHGRISAGRQECFKLSRICSTLGSRIVGKEYKVPEAGAQLLDSKLKEVASHTRELSRKKVPSIDIPEAFDSTKLEEETISTVSTGISQSESLLNKSNVDNVDTMVFSENECLTQSNDSEKTTILETATADFCEIRELEEDTIMNVSVNSEENNINELDDVEQEVVIEQREQPSNASAEVVIEQREQPSNASAEMVTEHQEQPSNASAEETETSSVSASKESQDSEHKESSENKEPRFASASASCNQKRSLTGSNAEHQSKKTIVPYESILTHFKMPRNTNPNGILCPFELMGTCNDGDCQFVHQTESQAK